MSVLNKFNRIVDNQYGKPKGVLGWIIGEKMIRQHKPETLWTIENLKLQENEHILEIGCGAGYALKMTLDQNRNNKMTGLDISKTLLHSAKIRNHRSVRKKRLKLIHGSVENLPFNDEQFSSVFSIHSIYFWENISNALREIHRVLKPGGTVHLTLCNGKDEETWDGMNNMIHFQVLPMMEQLHFNNVRLLNGPVSRGYKTISIIGNKE
ncbi:class I SAM-dependent methyltransferase [Rossellomorea sp. NPDC077527]|uniref:class I SAM-dependent methyltransferase n=1 Tax=Rossellomorea sp. NPDC077527 TaxID=3364510 RepID=UPI0037C7D4F8